MPRWLHLAGLLAVVALAVADSPGAHSTGAPVSGSEDAVRQPEPDPGVITGLLGEAARAREAGEMERAASLYARVLEIDPGHRVALYNAGIILENAGRPGLAAGIWERALRADPGDLYAWEHLLRAMAATDTLDQALAALQSEAAARPDAATPRLALALAHSAGGRWRRAVAVLEDFLAGRPQSNIAYNFLKDSFVSLADLEAYVADVGRRAEAAEAPEGLALLHVRLLLERGRAAEAMAAAGSRVWTDPDSRTLLTRAGLAAPETADEIRIARADLPGTTRPGPAGSPESEPAGAGPDATLPGGGVAEGDAAAGDGTDRSGAAGEGPDAGSVDDLPEPEPAPVEEFPDYGPDDPRSAPRYLAESRSALEEQDAATALTAVWKAVEASPMRLQPRILLAVLLEQEGRPGAARAALRGPVEPSPYDLYMQGWRAVRDDFIDAGYGGVDIFALRQTALPRLATVDDARAALEELLGALGDRYALLFGPDQFAGYLLAPNAGGGAPRVTSPWVPMPDTTAAGAIRSPGGAAPPPAGDAPAAPEAGAEAAATPDAAPRVSGPGSAAEEMSREMPPDSSEDPGRRRLHQLELKPPEDEGAPAHDEGDSPPSAEPEASGTFAVDPGPSVSLRPDGMAVLRLPSLSGLQVPAEVESELSDLPGFRGLVIDLRGNRGGDGEVAAEVASLFLPRGREICTYRTRRGREVRRSTRDEPFDPPAGLAVLTNGDTASAAELLAAALGESAGALRVGETTAGKGVGQRALLLPDGSGLSLTRFQLRSPGGRTWDRIGLSPDFPIAAGLPGSWGTETDSALEAALVLLRSGSRPVRR